jgi:hypothetical protein
LTGVSPAEADRIWAKLPCERRILMDLTYRGAKTLEMQWAHQAVLTDYVRGQLGVERKLARARVQEAIDTGLMQSFMVELLLAANAAIDKTAPQPWVSTLDSIGQHVLEIGLRGKKWWTLAWRDDDVQLGWGAKDNKGS